MFNIPVEQPRPRRKRLLGMSGGQVLFLAGMAMLDCLVLCAGSAVLFLILPGSDPNALLAALQPRAVTPTQIPSPTIFLSPTPSATPTSTPTLTPTRTATPFPGWVEYAGSEIALFLPEGFIAGDPTKDKVRIQYDLAAAGYKADVLDPVLNADPPFQFVAISKSREPEQYALVLATFIQGEADHTLDSFVVELISQEASSAFFLNRTPLKLDRYDAIRYVVEQKEDRTVREYRYLLKDEFNRFWQISYSAFMDYFDQHAPTFERSALTLRALR